MLLLYENIKDLWLRLGTFEVGFIIESQYLLIVLIVICKLVLF